MQTTRVSFRSPLLALALAACTATAAATPAAPPKPAAPAGEAPLPAALPAYAKDKPLPVADIARRTLDNGMQVWVVQRDGIPRVDFVLALRGAGLASDPPQQPGFADLLAATLTEGTASRDSRAIAEAAQGMGGGLGAGAQADGITVSANALASKAADMMALLAEVVRKPSFPEAEVALARTNALQGLKAAQAQPGYQAELALSSVVYGDHPYARTEPTAASIESVTREALVAAHASRVRPERALLVVAGRIAPARAFALAEQAFGDWKVEGEAPPETFPAPREAKPERVLVERDNSVQSTLRVARPGIPAAAEDYVPLQVTSTLLGGSFSSRVMQKLREEKGYTYGAGTSVRTNRVGGAITGSTDVRNEVTGDALKELFGEYERLGKAPPDAEELARVKRYVLGGYLIGNQLQGSVAATLARNWLLGLPAEFLAEYVPAAQAVTGEQVSAMARKYFDPSSQSIVVVGDKAVIEQLAPFGEFATRRPAGSPPAPAGSDGR